MTEWYPEDDWIAILRHSNSYEQAISRLKGLGFTYNPSHYRWEDKWHNWINDDVVQGNFSKE